jgi:hypothetical protein
MVAPKRLIDAPRALDLFNIAKNRIDMIIKHQQGSRYMVTVM